MTAKLTWRRLVNAYAKAGVAGVEKLVKGHNLPLHRCSSCEGVTPTFEDKCAICSTKRLPNTPEVCSRCGESDPDTTAACVALNCGFVDRSIEGPAAHRCDNCGAEYNDEGADASKISDFYERIANAPGETIPSGQCTCGALVYPIETSERTRLTAGAATYMAQRVRARLLNACTAVPERDAIRRIVTASMLEEIANDFNTHLSKKGKA
jgi:hypothetical protein